MRPCICTARPCAALCLLRAALAFTPVSVYLLYSAPCLLCLALCPPPPRVYILSRLFISPRVCIPPVSIFPPYLLHPPLFAPPSVSSPLSRYPPCAALSIPVLPSPCHPLPPPSLSGGTPGTVSFWNFPKSRRNGTLPPTSNPRCPCPALCFAGVTGRELTAQSRRWEPHPIAAVAELCLASPRSWPCFSQSVCEALVRAGWGWQNRAV